MSIFRTHFALTQYVCILYILLILFAFFSFARKIEAGAAFAIDENSQSQSEQIYGNDVKLFDFLIVKLFNTFILFCVIDSNVGSNPPIIKKIRKFPKILDGTYFIVIKNDEGKIHAKCTNCDEVKKGNIESTGNYKTHYKLMHDNLINEVEAYLKRPVTESNPKKAEKQPAIITSFRKISNDEVNFFAL